MEGPDASLCQNLSKLVLPLRRYCYFLTFQDGRCHLGFLKSRNFIGYWGSQGGGASVCQISSKSVNRCEDIKIFQFFKMTAAAILSCRIRTILLADGVRRVHTHHCTKFHQNRLFHCGDIAIFPIFKMAVAAILHF